jgi:hypothetical protein
MNIDRVDHPFPKLQLATGFSEKKHEVEVSTGLIPSAIDASEKILAHTESSASTEIHVDIDA